MGGRVSWAPEETLRGKPSAPPENPSSEATPFHTPVSSANLDGLQAQHGSVAVDRSAASASYNAEDIHRHVPQHQQVSVS